MKFKTNYTSPWALIYWGEKEPGKRPRTRLAFICKAIIKNGRIVSYSAHTHPWASEGRGIGWSKRPRKLMPGEIIKTWRHAPSLLVFSNAIKRLPVTP